MVPAQPFRMCKMLFFRHKKHLFDVDGCLNNSVLSKRCFLGITVLWSTRLAGGFLFRSLPLPQLPEGLYEKTPRDFSQGVDFIWRPQADLNRR